MGVRSELKGPMELVGFVQVVALVERAEKMDLVQVMALVEVLDKMVFHHRTGLGLVEVVIEVDQTPSCNTKNGSWK